MTDEEIKISNTVVVDEGPQVDSIFKTDMQMKEDVAPYKATQVDLLGLEKLRNFSTDEEIYKPIEAISQEKMDELRIPEDEKVTKTTFTAELEREEAEEKARLEREQSNPMASQSPLRERTQEEIERKLRTAPEWMHEIILQNTTRESLTTRAIGIDIAIYFAEVFRRKNPKIYKKKIGWFTYGTGNDKIYSSML